MSEHEQAGHGRPKQPGGGVTLSTIHGAKGREWSAVLLLRVNEDVLPLSSGLDDDEDLSEAQLAEERRLLYVGMTRARRVLKLSYTMLHADRTVGRASRFLKSIPPELVVKADHFELAKPRRRAVTGEAFAQPHAGSGAGAGTAAAQRQMPQQTPQQTPRGGAANPSSSRMLPPPSAGGAAADGPTGALAARLKAIQRGQEEAKEKKAAASARKAAREAAKAEQLAKPLGGRGRGRQGRGSLGADGRRQEAQGGGSQAAEWHGRRRR